MTQLWTQAIYLEDETIATSGVLALAQGQENINTVPMMLAPFHMYASPVPFVAPMVASPYDENYAPSILPLEVEVPLPTTVVTRQYLATLQKLASEAIAHCDKAVIDEIFSHMYDE